MIAPDPDARAVIAHFNSMFARDGGKVQFSSLEGPLLRVTYSFGDCDECVIAPEDIAGMMEELLERRRSTITKVELMQA